MLLILIFLRVGEYLDGGLEVRPVRVTYGNWGEGVLDLVAVVDDLDGSPDWGVRVDSPSSSSMGWGDDRDSLGEVGESAEGLSPPSGEGEGHHPGEGVSFSLPSSSVSVLGVSVLSPLLWGEGGGGGDGNESGVLEARLGALTNGVPGSLARSWA